MGDFNDDPRIKTRKKFYDKIRSHLQDFEVKVDACTTVNSTTKPPDIRTTYGLVTKEELTKLLKTYDDQQKNKDLANNSIKCDQVAGGSFAKLLYSKPGFHNPGSTSHLIEDLKIRDIYRNSFLGGHSTYATGSADDLDTIHKQQQKLHITAVSNKIFTVLESPGGVQEAAFLLREIEELDRDNVDVMAARGRYGLAIKEVDFAVKELRKAVNEQCSFPDLVKENLAKALFDKGSCLFNRRDYTQATSFFVESLSHDPSHQNANLHLSMCREKLVTKQFGADTSFSRYRG